MMAVLAVLFLAYPAQLVGQGTARLRNDLSAILRAANADGGRRGLLVFSLDRGDTLFSTRADERFAPASNLKLFTVAAALRYLSPEFRWQTYLLTTGTVADGVLRGDVVLYGTGDPTLSRRMDAPAAEIFAALADTLYTTGVREVAGDVVADGSFFGGEGIGPGWNPADLREWYTATSSALTADENVAGTARVPVRQPTRRTAEMLRAALRERGITVRGRARAAFEPAESPAAFHRLPSALLPGPSGRVVAIHRSPPLAEVARVTNYESHNFFADQLLKTVGRVVLADGDFEAGARAVRRLLAEAGVDTTARIVDGSGLSPLDAVTPRMVVALLAWMARGTDSTALRASLPIAATREGLTSRMRGTAAAGNLRAKTGTITRVSALSGYVITTTGEQLVFSIIANDVRDIRRAKQFEDRIGARLAELRR